MERKTIRKRGAFTLVELVVVVLILGIIAAVAAPRMFDTASDARQNATKSSLVVLRDAIELYKSQNGGYPPAATLPVALKPFLKGPFPVAQVVDSPNATVIVTTQNPITTPETGGAGWTYNENTGDIVINHATYIAF